MNLYIVPLWNSNNVSFCLKVCVRVVAEFQVWCELRFWTGEEKFAAHRCQVNHFLSY